MKFIQLFFFVLAFVAVFGRKRVEKCRPVPQVKCPVGEVYLQDGPGDKLKEFLKKITNDFIFS